jgi:4-hydroxy-tetrahydrodipicolinate reductase
MSDPSAGDLRLAVAGDSGRLGTAVRQAATREGMVVCGVDQAPTVIVDASHRDALAGVIAACHAQHAALIACVSDLTDDDLDRLRELAEESVVVRAVNLTIGHWLQTKVVRLLAAATAGMRPEASVLERHGAHKRDRPSASAKALAAHWPPGVAELASLRHGPPVSEHTFRLTLNGGETLTVVHDVRRPDAPADGALLAARWAHAASPGYFSIEKVFDAMTGAVHGY